MLPENVSDVAGVGCRAEGLETRDRNTHGLSFQSREGPELLAARCCWIHAVQQNRNKACGRDGKIYNSSFDDNSKYIRSRYAM